MAKNGQILKIKKKTILKMILKCSSTYTWLFFCSTMYAGGPLSISTFSYTTLALAKQKCYERFFWEKVLRYQMGNQKAEFEEGQAI